MSEGKVPGLTGEAEFKRRAELEPAPTAQARTTAPSRPVAVPSP